ncbi:hypothetical protein HWV62_2001 [Athelia sp. TMB]|nr:hypothetical protein HWV62_2001 [Athelia sp. TMB]
MGIGIQTPFSAVAGPLYTHPSVTVSIESLFNNQAVSRAGRGQIADFDGWPGRYSSPAREALTISASYQDMEEAMMHNLHTSELEANQYELPAAWGLGPDNILVDSQIIDLSEPIYVHEAHLVYAGDGTYGTSEAKFLLTYEDGSTESIQLSAKNWYTSVTLNVGAIQTPYHYVSGGALNWNTSNIFQWSTSISSKLKLKSIAFPSRTTENRLHIFSLSLTPSLLAADAVLSVRRVSFTTRWEDVLGVKTQVVVITLANLVPETNSFSSAITLPIIVQIFGAGIMTIQPGIVYRLMGSDQVRVEVLVIGTGTFHGDASVLITNMAGKVLGISEGWPVSPLREEWTADASVLGTHESASWDVIYDDFIANFTGSHFNASEWLDIFDEAGAKYFVLTTKHHDGYALWDTGNTTNRNSAKLGPKRDFLAELFETAKKEKPFMHRGTYFSMPEWFSPDYAPYGFQDFPGGLAHNAFNTSKIEPYTGRLDINDYLRDLQLPQMLDLAENYDTEIMWCDISSANLTLDFAARFYSHAEQDGRQVVMNDRCGNVPDFDTPEYSTYGSIQTRKWETSEGMDPNSYGLNKATPPSKYKNGSVIIRTLVDVASKNGNYLLDVGPDAEGRIIEPMVSNLLDAGKWLKHSGECVYDTDYWYKGSEDPSGSVRFLTTPETFCIVTFTRPENGKLVIENKQLPVLPGDTVFLLGPNYQARPGDHSGLPWSLDETTGAITINITEKELEGIDFAWAFKVVYEFSSDV